ncbi:MAG: hypothetical protein DMG06_18745 [Acidobacteria bacterium]|nr:MAG: hypothetical protein DMG06_18745 [Acidobacteriota bacterium]
MELFHAAQAVDLRRRTSPHLVLGRATRAIYEAYRKAVPFLDKDRNLSIEIERSHDFLLAWNSRYLSQECGRLFNLPLTYLPSAHNIPSNQGA